MEQDIQTLIEMIRALGIITSVILAGVVSIIGMMFINKANEKNWTQALNCYLDINKEKLLNSHPIAGYVVNDLHIV